MTEKVYGFSFGADDWGWMWGDENPRQRHRRRHRNRRVRFESGEMRYVILRLLKDKPMHGYEVMKALTEETDGWYKPSPGTVYPTLQWLEDEGLVRCEEADGKKVYHITDAGIEFLEDNQDTVDDIFERIADTIEQVFSDPMPDVTRLIGQLLGKTYKAAWKVRDDVERQEMLIRILETAIRKIDDLQTSGPAPSAAAGAASANAAHAQSGADDETAEDV